MAKKQSWDKRYQAIRKSYPNLDTADWNKAISDDDIFIKVIGDVLKSERKISTPGKRPGLTKSDGIERLNKILERHLEVLLLEDLLGLSMLKLA